MVKLERAEVIAQGKTKTICAVAGDPSLVILENRDDLTKNDDPGQTRQLVSKAKFATATTCAVFALLEKAGLPVAFKSQLSDTEFLAPRCAMIPIEVVLRRYAAGSYLKRFPNLTAEKGGQPYRFHRLVFELFLKTTGGAIIDKNGKPFGQTPVDPLSGHPIEDPLIADPENIAWHLEHPKLPRWDERSDLNISLPGDLILPKNKTVADMEKIARRTFLVLEGAWAQIGCRLVDLKMELGIDCDGKILVADVIDNDNWRLRSSDGKELSKQLFRDGSGMEEIAYGYSVVARLVKTFAVPRQAIVIWSGSLYDKAPCPPNLPNVENVGFFKSGHKSPSACLAKLEELRAAYPEGGVIIAVVGKSNGLGPLLAARSCWPVIAVPADFRESPHNVWSSLEMPSGVPMLTALSADNAVLAALNILAQKNPVAYMHRQYAIEELDG